MQRGAEEWARRIVATHLGLVVDHHDDGTEDGMYDLRIGPREDPEAAIEVVGAVDQIWTETWNVGPARAIIDLPGQSGRWIVGIEPGARIKQLKGALPPLIAELAALGISNLLDPLDLDDMGLCARLQALGIDHAHRYADDAPGAATLTMNGAGGAVDDEGIAVTHWLHTFLRAQEQADVLSKLSLPEANRREVFIGATFMGPPWSVMSYLTGLSEQEPRLPPDTPDLPEPVTGVWIAATLSFKDPLGLYWDGRTWSHCRIRGAGIDD